MPVWRRLRLAPLAMKSRAAEDHSTEKGRISRVGDCGNGCDGVAPAWKAWPVTDALQCRVAAWPLHPLLPPRTPANLIEI